MIKTKKVLLILSLFVGFMAMRIGFAQKNLIESAHFQVSIGVVHKKGFDATPILVSELHSLEEIELTKWKSLELKDGTSFNFVMIPSKNDLIQVKGTIRNKMADAHKPVEFLLKKQESVTHIFTFVDNQSVEITMKVERKL
jgi:hypothetical protein